MAFSLPRKPKPYNKPAAQIAKEAGIATGFNLLGNLASKGLWRAIEQNLPPTRAVKEARSWDVLNAVGQLVERSMGLYAGAEEQLRDTSVSIFRKGSTYSRQGQGRALASIAVAEGELAKDAWKEKKKYGEGKSSKAAVAEIDRSKKAIGKRRQGVLAQGADYSGSFQGFTKEKQEIIRKANGDVGSAMAEQGRILYQIAQVMVAQAQAQGVLKEAQLRNLDETMKNVSTMADTMRERWKSYREGHKAPDPTPANPSVEGQNLSTSVPRGNVAVNSKIFGASHPRFSEVYQSGYQETHGKGAKGALKSVTVRFFSNPQDISTHLNMDKGSQDFIQPILRKNKIWFNVSSDLAPGKAYSLIKDKKLTIHWGNRDQSSKSGLVRHIQGRLVAVGVLAKTTQNSKGKTVSSVDGVAGQSFHDAVQALVNNHGHDTNGFFNSVALSDLEAAEEEKGIKKVSSSFEAEEAPRGRSDLDPELMKELARRGMPVEEYRARVGARSPYQQLASTGDVVVERPPAYEGQLEYYQPSKRPATREFIGLKPVVFTKPNYEAARAIWPPAGGERLKYLEKAEGNDWFVGVSGVGKSEGRLSHVQAKWLKNVGNRLHEDGAPLGAEEGRTNFLPKRELLKFRRELLDRSKYRQGNHPFWDTASPEELEQRNALMVYLKDRYSLKGKSEKDKKDYNTRVEFGPYIDELMLKNEYGALDAKRQMYQHETSLIMMLEHRRFVQKLAEAGGDFQGLEEFIKARGFEVKGDLWAGGEDEWDQYVGVVEEYFGGLSSRTEGSEDPELRTQTMERQRAEEAPVAGRQDPMAGLTAHEEEMALLARQEEGMSYGGTESFSPVATPQAVVPAAAPAVAAEPAPAELVAAPAPEPAETAQGYRARAREYEDAAKAERESGNDALAEEYEGYAREDYELAKNAEAVKEYHGPGTAQGYRDRAQEFLQRARSARDDGDEEKAKEHEEEAENNLALALKSESFGDTGPTEIGRIKGKPEFLPGINRGNVPARSRKTDKVELKHVTFRRAAGPQDNLSDQAVVDHFNKASGGGFSLDRLVEARELLKDMYQYRQTEVAQFRGAFGEASDETVKSLETRKNKILEDRRKTLVAFGRSASQRVGADLAKGKMLKGPQAVNFGTFLGIIAQKDPKLLAIFTKMLGADESLAADYQKTITEDYNRRKMWDKTMVDQVALEGLRGADDVFFSLDEGLNRLYVGGGDTGLPLNTKNEKGETVVQGAELKKKSILAHLAAGGQNLRTTMMTGYATAAFKSFWFTMHDNKMIREEYIETLKEHAEGKETFVNFPTGDVSPIVDLALLAYFDGLGGGTSDPKLSPYSSSQVYEWIWDFKDTVNDPNHPTGEWNGMGFHIYERDVTHSGFKLFAKALDKALRRNLGSIGRDGLRAGNYSDILEVGRRFGLRTREALGITRKEELYRKGRLKRIERKGR